MKKNFSKKSLQRDYVFRFRVKNYNFTCKLISVNRGFDGLVDLPYITYRCFIYSPVFYTMEIPHLMSCSNNLNYRTFRSIVQDEVVSYISQTLFD